MKQVPLLTVLLVITTLWLPSVRAAAFMDVTRIEVAAGTATGTLNGIPFTLRTTRAVPRPAAGDAGLVGGVTDGTSTLFSNATRFTPSLPLGDFLALGSASDYRIEFTQPVSNLTLHISQLEANLLSFTSGGVPAAFTLLSSDGDLTPSAGNTAIQGSPGAGDDANGSILFSGTFSELSWTSMFGTGTTANTGDDGMGFQMSAVAESPPYLHIVRLGMQQVQLTWSTNNADYTLESTPVLPATTWELVTNSVDVAGPQFAVTVSAGETKRFFRLHRK